MTLVPYRPGDERRSWCWDVARYWLAKVGWPIYVSDCTGEQFNISPARNAASAEADADGRWDVALVTDTDVIVSSEQLHRSLAWLRSSGGAVRPHSERWMLTETGSTLFSQRGPDAVDVLDSKHVEKMFAGGGQLLVTRDAWESVNGFDENFIGWGREDSVMNINLLASGYWERLPGDAWHLWHPRSSGRVAKLSDQLYRAALKDHRTEIIRWAANKGLEGRERPEFVL